MNAERIIDVLMDLDPLSALPRTGWLLRGVSDVETVAAHSYGVAVVVMFLVDALRADGQTVDGERALRMALLHDAAEAKTGDVPMPHKTPAMSAALHALEKAIVDDMLPPTHAALWLEAEAEGTLEARIVKAADKIQMMVKVHTYEQQGRGLLYEFWANENNFRDEGLAPARAVYAALARRAGKPLPASRATVTPSEGSGPG